MASKEEILQIKERADIIAIVGEYLSLKKAGKNWLGLCPFHQEKTPSFTVSPELGIYKCFGCGRSGDVISFVQEADHSTFGEAIEKLAARVGVELSRSQDSSPEFQLQQRIIKTNTQVATVWQYFLWKHPAGREALQYVQQKRHFTEETIRRFGLGYTPKNGSVILESLNKKGLQSAELEQFGLAVEGKRGRRDKFIDRIMFPVHNASGQIIAFSGRVFRAGDERPKYLNSPETAAFKKRFNLFGLYQAKEAIRKQDQAILVEGQTDVISSSQVGVAHIVAPLGTGLTSDQLQLLGRYSKNVIFATDNDQAGFRSACRGALEAVKLGLTASLLPLPEEFHDVDELIQKDLKQWKQLVTKAIPWLDQGIAWYQSGKPPAHVAQVWPNREITLRFLVDLVRAMKDPVTQQVAQRQLQEGLELSSSAMQRLLGESTPTVGAAQPEPEHQSYLGLEEHLVHVALSQPQVVKTFPQVVAFISQPPYQTLLREIQRWADQDPAGLWVKINVDPEQVPFSTFIQWLCLHHPELDQIVKEYGLLHEVKETTAKVYAEMCRRLMKERSTYIISTLRKQLAAAESIDDQVEIERLTGKITKLQSFLQ